MSESPDLEGMPFAALWAELPELATRERVNPFSFRERMGLYRALIEAVGQPEFMGADRRHHFLWAYAAQLFWQHASGRLGAPGSDALKPSSWWGNMNSTLSVVPWVAAMNEGLATSLSIEPPPSRERYGLFVHGDPHKLHVPPALRGPLRSWERLLRRLAKASDPAEREATRKVSWRVHLASIRAGEQLYGHDLDAYPKLEQLFCRGWTRMVDFLGASAWRTDLVFLREQGVGNLPPRILRDDDEPGRIEEFSRAVNRSTRSIVRLGQRPVLAHAWARFLWARAMRDAELRRDAPTVVDATFGGRGRDPELRRRFRRALLRP